jgi:flavin-binding protein dodecin
MGLESQSAPRRRYVPQIDKIDCQKAGIWGIFEAAATVPAPLNWRSEKMAKKSESGVYRVTEIIGTSTVSWEAAAKNAVDAAAKSLRDLRVAEISKLDMKIEGGKVVAYRARVQLSFKYGS